MSDAERPRWYPREWIKEFGEPQNKDIAAHAGVSPSTMSEIVNNKPKRLKHEDIELLAKGLTGCRPDTPVVPLELLMLPAMAIALRPFVWRWRDLAELSSDEAEDAIESALFRSRRARNAG